MISLGLTGLLNLFFPTLLPISTVVVAFVICILIGVIFGLAPAWTAARSEPIEALRYE
jgi:putative ABC transport system permease protein